MTNIQWENDLQVLVLKTRLVLCNVHLSGTCSFLFAHIYSCLNHTPTNFSVVTSTCFSNQHDKQIAFKRLDLKSTISKTIVKSICLLFFLLKRKQYVKIIQGIICITLQCLCYNCAWTCVYDMAKGTCAQYTCA